MTVPETCRLSEDIDALIGRPAGWLYRRSGVYRRYVCDKEDQIDLAVSAARAALNEARLSPDDVEFILFAAAVPYQSIPSTAPLIQARLGITDGACMAFDINSTCLSFVTALDIASHMVGNKVALVVASEVASRALPWAQDPATAALFGDGAAAVVITGQGDGRLLASRMETYPSGYDACSLGAGGTRYDYHADREAFDRHSRFHMEGDALFKLTLRHFEPFLDRLLDQAGWQRDDVELIVPHQASPGALAHLTRRCGFSADIVMNIVRDYGNQIAASIPTALHLARQRHPAGLRTLILGTSAGMSLGGLALIL
ncbi:3-oxoacyl-[acyl-carrier-protein] synthase III C-terminal domain-containing protein [Asticcacaulis sp. ZE23SCel15]|uniref:3-oxoacyl-ACP synthase III family protein n=1 Tax=Asticcacaulis sp. ZE23SCel15 TaxID=3059027 RepID=UPI00265DEDA5|nr:3-oxoacyl-[acyl-carrier-protein] synthase III C-terminal domain-containing protein [Asticcacaulis sp. ZE23SCel15]WKL57600.1 3-oxoacyl-[acyl-carrier-protein] synthase III C-terminal domain-containing protein [Asticcacaulis sp. ZE23SCel15]